MCRCLRGAWLSSAFLVAACIDNGGPTAPATSSVGIEVPAPGEPQLTTTFVSGADSPSPNATAPSDPGSAPGGAPGGGVVVVPPTGSTATTLTSGALLVVGDTLALVGNQMAALGGALPLGVGSIVTLASGVPTQAGEALQNSNGGLDATLSGVLAASLNPLQSSSTLLAPAASAPAGRPAVLARGTALVSPRLQQALAGGLTGVVGGVTRLATLAPLLANGAPTALLTPSLAGTGSMPTTGVPLAGLASSGAATTGAAMTGAAMTAASMTAASARPMPTMTAMPTAPTSGLLSTVTATTAPVAQTLNGVGKTVGSTAGALTGTVTGTVTGTLNKTLNGLLGGKR